jgi:hypothetical protein
MNNEELIRKAKWKYPNKTRITINNNDIGCRSTKHAYSLAKSMGNMRKGFMR